MYFLLRANKTAPSSSTPVPEPRPMPVAVLILGLPPPPKDKPKLPRAILPVDVQKPMEAVNTEQLEEGESASRETETPVRQNAVIQTEIYGVENLAVEGRENQPNAKVVGTKQDKNVIKPVQRTAKSRLKPDKENLQMSTNKKSTTGMQTSVSLFPRKRLKTVTGTQTSGDYILKKAMASADIPIQRKTVGSQVTPQKPGAKLARKRATCSSETQTGISPEKKSKDDAETGLTDGSVESGVQFEKEIEVAEILSDSFPASAQSFKSNIERNKQMGVNTVSGNILSITPNGNLIISPSSSGASAQKAGNAVNPLADIAPTFVESLGLKATKTQSMVSKQISTSSSEPTNATSSRFENTGGTIASTTKDKTMKPKRNTIRNLLTESEKNYVPISESTRIYRPFISTTSGITFNNSLATYSNSHTAQTGTSSNKTAASSSVSPYEHSAQPDYDSHKLFNPIQDQMLGGRQNENSNTNTIDMEAQAMSASEFEQLLLSSGLLLEVGAQTEPILEYGIQNGTPNLSNTASLSGHNKITGFDHKEMATETLTEFDFLNESSSTIDMNTQTITDFGSLLGPMDSDTQTVSGIDFLDLVMTNMETQTLSDQDLIDLGLMDAAHTSIEPFCMEMDYLKSSETQTSLVSLVESGTNSGMDRNRNVDHNTTMVDKTKTSKTSETMTEKVISAATALTILGNNRNAEAKCVKENNNAIKDAAAEPQKTTNSEQDQSEGFQTNMETQTAFDELEKLAS